MDITAINLSSFSNEEIYNKLIPLIKTLRSKPAYVGLSDTEMQKIALKEIELSRVFYKGKNDYTDFVIQRVGRQLSMMVENKLSDSTTSFDYINDFINRGIKFSDDYSKALDNIHTIDEFLKRYSYVPDHESLTKLLDNNATFNKTIELIVKKNIKTITDGNINDVFNDDILLLAISSYCMNHNIVINENYDEDLSDIKPNDDLYLYKKDVNNYPLLTPLQELELARKMRDGDKEAKDLFICSNLRLAMSIACKYRRGSHNMALADLIQEGNVGLMMAAEKYNPDKGYKFSTYATHWIRRSIINGILNKSKTVRIPINKYNQVGNFKRVYQTMSKELNKEPTMEEVAKRMKLDEKTVLELYNLSQDPLSLNETYGDEQDIELGDMIPDGKGNVDDVIIRKSLSNEMLNLFDAAGLDYREQYIIIKRYGLLDNCSMTLEEIGDEFNMSRERIRQLEARAISKLRNSKDIKKFSVYMDNVSRSENNIDKYRDNYFQENGRYKKFLSSYTFKGKQGTNKSIQTQNIYELLGGYPKILIDSTIKKLTDEEKQLITLRYGNDLEHPTTSNLSDEQSYIFYSKLIPKLKRKLSRTRVDDYHKVIIPKEDRKKTKEKASKIEQTKEKIEKAVDNEIKEKYTDEPVQNESAFLRELRNIEKRKTQNNKTIYEMQKINNEVKRNATSSQMQQPVGIESRRDYNPQKEGYRKIADSIEDKTEEMIFRMKYDLIDGRHYDEDKICKAFNVSKEEINDITNKAIVNYLNGNPKEDDYQSAKKAKTKKKVPRKK
jgi:RNA polymerase primary sigma factor